jgi:hypothetical protein
MEGRIMRWQKRITKKQLKHIRETTTNGTLREFKENREFHHKESPSREMCWDCRKIALRLKIEK